MRAKDIVRVARRRSGLTQRRLAQKRGISVSSISRIERGFADPRVDTLDRLVRACGMELEPMDRHVLGDRHLRLVHEMLELTPLQRLQRATKEARIALARQS